MYNSFKSQIEMLFPPDWKLSTPLLFFRVDRTVNQYNQKKIIILFSFFFYKNLKVGLKGYQKGSESFQINYGDSCYIELNYSIFWGFESLYF